MPSSLPNWPRALRAGLPCLAAAALLIGSPTASATLIAYENFESYTASTGFGTALVGQTDGNAAWNGGWQVGAGDTDTAKVINENPLSYSAGVISVSGGSQTLRLPKGVGQEYTITRQLSAGTSGEVWFSFLFRPGYEGSYADFNQIYLSNDADTNNSAAIVPDARDASGFRARITSGGGTVTNAVTNVFPADDVTYFLVGRISADGPAAGLNLDRIQLWINPTSLTLGSSNAFASADTGISSMTHFSIRNFGFESGDSVLMDEIRIGTTLEDVIPIPEPAPMALLAGVLATTMLIRRHHRSARH